MFSKKHGHDDRLVRALSLTHEMLSLARAGEWRDAELLAEERFQLLQQVHMVQDAASAEKQAGMIQEIQRHDELIATLSRKSLEDVTHHLRHLHQGRKASKAYQQKD